MSVNRQDDLKESLMYGEQQGKPVQPVQAEEPADKKSLAFRFLKVSFLFFMWYSLNLGYNVYNKKFLNAVKIPWTLSVFQLACGLICFAPLWLTGLRVFPKITTPRVKALFPIGLFHCGTHLSAVIALAIGNVSAFHVLKAAEPFFTAVFSGVIMHKVYAWYVYVCIIPVVGGVGYSALKADGGINMLAFTGAMVSNLSSSLRSIYGKMFMNNKTPGVDDDLTPANIFSLAIIYSVLISIPFAFLFEMGEMFTAWDARVNHPEEELRESHQTLMLWGLASGLFYYTYNEVAFSALGEIHAVTHAVGNTIKRVVLIVASAIIFNETFNEQAKIGTTIGMLGVLAYALAKYYSERKPKQAEWQPYENVVDVQYAPAYAAEDPSAPAQ